MSSLFHLSAKEINSCLHFIADRRVQGADWEEIAQDLERPLQEVRRFVYLHEEVFRLQLKKARQEQKQHCYDTAFEVLRQQTVSKNEKISHSAACHFAPPQAFRRPLASEKAPAKNACQSHREQASPCLATSCTKSTLHA